jgi:hypothetical protein
MFSAQLITFFFIAMFVGPIVSQFLVKRGATTLAKTSMALVCVASVYCLLAGLFLAAGWEDPFANASAAEVGHAAATHRGRGGIFILAIRLWPYVLIGLGGYMTYLSIPAIVSMLKPSTNKA